MKKLKFEDWNDRTEKQREQTKRAPERMKCMKKQNKVKVKEQNKQRIKKVWKTKKEWQTIKKKCAIESIYKKEQMKDSIKRMIKHKNK